MGKVITYWRRYNLVALLNLKIVWEDDDAQGVGTNKKSVPSGNNFVSTIIKGWNVDKAKTLLAKVQAGEYVLSAEKLSELEDFITDNE